jgi:glutamate-1-semialdehyde aminotransferase
VAVLSELLASERAKLAERTPASGAMFRRAARSLAGGVTSSFQRGDPRPGYVARGEGARVLDVDGNEYHCDGDLRAQHAGGAGSPPSVPWGEGIPRATVEQVHAVAWGDADAMERRAAELAAAGRAPACVILEPVLTGGRVVPPPPAT